MDEMWTNGGEGEMWIKCLGVRGWDLCKAVNIILPL